LTILAAAVVYLAVTSPASADNYVQTNLTSDIPGLAANTNPNLINPWGMSFSATSPFWVSDEGSNVATLFNGAGVANALVVLVPGGPTGQVFNSAGAGNFVLSDGSAASFIFATLGGTIQGWNLGAGTAALQAASTTSAVYTGLALANAGTTIHYLYAANFIAGGGINVFDSSFANVTSTTFAGKFVDPNLPAGYAPYNIQLIGTTLYVEYAEIGPAGLVTGAGLGYVVEFDVNGNFLGQLVSGGPLNAPWGVALAPSTGFGQYSGDLLVGNFGNGEINAFNPTTGAFLGALDGSNGQPLVNSGLWAIDFGNVSANPDALYFNAGIDGGGDGLFGEIQLAPEPGSLGILLTGIGLLLVIRKRATSGITQIP
jgi:uncharacterized protein (TIGR03118 family)